MTVPPAKLHWQTFLDIPKFMKKWIITSLCLLISTASLAQEQPTITGEAVSPKLERERNSREGFFLGFGLGGGGIHAGNLNRGAGFGNFRIGGGVSEKLLVMGETLSSSTKKNGVTTSANALHLSSQIFITNRFFARPGIGVSVLNSSTTTGATTTTYSSDAGLSFILTEGYEFRFGKSFALSPEATFNYARVDNTNVMNYGVVIGALWYFR